MNFWTPDIGSQDNMHTLLRSISDKVRFNVDKVRDTIETKVHVEFLFRWTS